MIQDGFASHEIWVTPYEPAIRTALEAEGIQSFELKPREEDPGPNGTKIHVKPREGYSCWG